MRFWRTRHIYKARYIQGQGKSGAWYHDRLRILKKARRLLCGIRVTFQIYSYVECEQIRAGGWTAEKGSNYFLMGICLLPLHTPLRQRLRRQGYFVRYAAKHHQHTVPDTHMVTIRSEHAQSGAISMRRVTRRKHRRRLILTRWSACFQPAVSDPAGKRMEDHSSAGNWRGCDGISAEEERDADTSGSLLRISRLSVETEREQEDEQKR